jgi:hypothetical protein
MDAPVGNDGQRQPRWVISQVDTYSPEEAFDYGFGVCRDNSLEALAMGNETDADPTKVAAAISLAFPVTTRPAVLDGCAAGFAEQARRGGPVAEQARAKWLASHGEQTPSQPDGSPPAAGDVDLP